MTSCRPELPIFNKLQPLRPGSLFAYIFIGANKIVFFLIFTSE
ncbi:hypothetical protein HMPREF1861_01540 [Corynebacterium kroppenstedtii]|nr:hypothetical protein HMPREF1861_01540 [Corynebacterium kroppenstedtii]